MVEDVFKNVQALKGITVDEFMGTMGIMSASLGLCCNDCHPGAGTDSVRVGRGHESAEGDRPRHGVHDAGHQPDQLCRPPGRHVLDLPSLRVTPLETPQARRSSMARPITELDDVITKAAGVPPSAAGDRQVSPVLGGADKVAGVTSITATGKVVAFGSFGGGGNFEFFAQAPDKRAMLSHLGPRGDSIRTFDGRAGWFSIPLRRAEIPADRRRARRRAAGRAVDLPLAIAHVADGAARRPIEELNGKRRLPRAGERRDGSLASLYFDAGYGAARTRASATRRRRSAGCRRRWTTTTTATSAASSSRTSGPSRGWTAATIRFRRREVQRADRRGQVRRACRSARPVEKAGPEGPTYGIYGTEGGPSGPPISEWRPCISRCPDRTGNPTRRFRSSCR